MEELITNLHMHTVYSDGTGTHTDLLEAALKTDVDVIIVTDHNVLVNGVESYRQSKNNRTVLMLVGQEVHDQARDPQKSHLLIFGANRDLASYARDPQQLINNVNQSGGICFLAHPHEDALPLFNEPDISWDDWDVRGFTGLEIWNGLSEFKSRIKGKLSAIYYSFFPAEIARGAHPLTLKKWDDLLVSGQKVVAVGGADAHALRVHMGFLSRVIFPYEFHFSAINTHLLTPTGLTGSLPQDRTMIYQAFRQGHAFVGYDLAASTRGFRFSAQGKDQEVIQGDEINLKGGSVTLQVRLPRKADCRLIHNGTVIKTWPNRDMCIHITSQPGVYRVECDLPHNGGRRGWIYSNPIYVKAR